MWSRQLCLSNRCPWRHADFTLHAAFKPDFQQHERITPRTAACLSTVTVAVALRYWKWMVTQHFWERKKRFELHDVGNWSLTPRCEAWFPALRNALQLKANRNAGSIFRKRHKQLASQNYRHWPVTTIEATAISAVGFTVVLITEKYLPSCSNVML